MGLDVVKFLCSCVSKGLSLLTWKIIMNYCAPIEGVFSMEEGEFLEPYKPELL